MDNNEKSHNPRREQAPEISSDDEDELIIYCAFSDHETESDEPNFDYTKPVLSVDPVRPISRETEYEEAMAAQERARARAERRHQHFVAVANGDTSVKLPKTTLRRTNPGIPPHKGGQLPRRFPLEKIAN